MVFFNLLFLQIFSLIGISIFRLVYLGNRLYLWGSLVTLELICLIPLVESPEVNPLAVKLLDNRL